MNYWNNSNYIPLKYPLTCKEKKKGRHLRRSIWKMQTIHLHFCFNTALWTLGFRNGSAVKESASKAGDMGSIPGSGRSTGGGNGNPSILAGKSHGQGSVEGYSPQSTNSWTQLSNWTCRSSSTQYQHKSISSGY